MTPDAVLAEGITSTLVDTVIPSPLPPFATPMVQPTRVTVTAVPAASALSETDNTMDVAPGCAGVSVAPAVDTLAVGIAEVAKKPDG